VARGTLMISMWEGLSGICGILDPVLGTATSPMSFPSPIPSGGYGRCVDERKLLMRMARGAVTNVAFADLRRLAEALGFELRRVRGSHHVFAHPDIAELINLQAVRGQAISGSATP
jgi:hypothetical protein